MTFQDFLAAIAVVINGLPQGLLALNFGFGAFPTALGFLAGTVGMLLFGQVAPISFQAEAIVLAGTLGKDRNERLNIVFFTGILMAIIGGIGLLQPTIDFIGPSILNGMMAGVGFLLAKVGIDMVKADKTAGGVSMLTAIFTYFLTSNLVYTIVISVFASSLLWLYLNKKNKVSNNEEVNLEYERFIPLKFNFSKNVIRSTLAVVTLQIGGNIAYSSITGSIANKPVNVDAVTLYSGIADAVSAFFGGGPVEAIISGTAVAPNPVISGVIMMLIIAAILFTKLLPKIAKYVPSESIAGFLFVLGAIVVFPSHMGLGLEGTPIVGGVTAIVTAVTDPFIGMIAGIATRFLMNIF
ncbi:NCS2 family permease [Tissierella carlieri]|jgi:AGZA family xanthine/uracil permease-like MFS transporter|uniref:NCS2 family permease n=1 Tax=Tissierella carlieri TaxID=689904 RepID=UPI0028051F54|nr:NCS2 family permease [uncultured Tissierella sp.]MDU5083393.1 NCS2 family permease [Bacillota bacterium]